MWDILGIKPTKDIKEIKTAYARLAKQFNPEEHPEEFKRIFDAYKAACNYAKGRGRSNISVELKTVEKLKQSSEEKEENGEKLSFEKVNLNGGKTVEDKKDLPPEFKFKFDEQDRKRHSESDGQKSENFDFSSVNELYDDEAEEKKLAELRRCVLAVMKRVLKDKGGYKQWADLFDWENFSAVKDDIEFRISAAGLLKDILFSKDTAMLIAENFGMGSRVVIHDYRNDRWRVHIVKGTEKKPEEKKKIRTVRDFFNMLKSRAQVVFAIAAVIVITVLPAVLDPDNVGESGAENASEAKTVSELSFDEAMTRTFTTDALYEMCRGKWSFKFGYIELKDDGTFEMEYDGEFISGEAICAAADTGARLMIEFSAPDTEIDGTTANAGIFFNNELCMVYTDSDGMINTSRSFEKI